jgi:hypothetical protein
MECIFCKARALAKRRGGTYDMKCAVCEASWNVYVAPLNKTKQNKKEPRL